MRRRPWILATRDRGRANDSDRNNRQSDETIGGDGNGHRAARVSEARALVRLSFRRAMMAAVHAGHRIHAQRAVVHGTVVMAERLGRRENKRETDQEGAQPSPDHFNRKTSTCGLRLAEKAPVEVPNTIVTEFAPDGVET